jgi:DNA-binding XRE family transcriptional regulator
MSEIGKIIPLRGQALEPLWREVLGDRLRSLRADRDETLAQTAERAGISPQYLSEIERGRKEASSEMIAALAGALGVTVADLMAATADDLRRIAGTVLAASTVITRTAAGASVTGSSATGSSATGSSATGSSATGSSATGSSATRSVQRPSGPVALAMAA